MAPVSGTCCGPKTCLWDDRLHHAVCFSQCSVCYCTDMGGHELSKPKLEKIKQIIGGKELPDTRGLLLLTVCDN